MGWAVAALLGLSASGGGAQAPSELATYHNERFGFSLSYPAGRFAEASEVACAIAFLASPAAAYINGINVPVDGGRTACL